MCHISYQAALHSLLLHQAMGACYVGFDNKAAVKTSHPQYLICDSVLVFSTLPLVLALWSVEQSETRSLSYANETVLRSKDKGFL